MRLINTNLLNYFYKNGVKPLKDSLAKKFDASKLVNNLLTTASGFALDARQGPVIQGELDAINSKLAGFLNLTPIGHTDSVNTRKSISFDLTPYSGIYAVGYAPTSKKYIGGVFMPKSLFLSHPQVIDYYNVWNGTVEYDESTKEVTIESDSTTYTLYAYAIGKI